MNTEMIYHFTKSPLTDDFNYKEYRIYNDKERKLVPKPTQRNLDGSRSKEGFILTNDYDRFDDNWYEGEVVEEFKDMIERQDVLNVIKGSNGGNRAKEIRELNLGIEHPALMPNYLPVLPILSFTEINDTVLDMFGGTGTTCLTANKLNRNGVMYDTKPDNIKLALEGNRRYNDAIATMNKKVA